MPLRVFHLKVSIIDEISRIVDYKECRGPIMQIDTIIRSTVGADLSRPSPIDRPSVAVPLSGLFFNSHYRARFIGSLPHFGRIKYCPYKFAFLQP